MACCQSVLTGNVEVDIGGVAAKFVDLGSHGHAVRVQHVGDDHPGSLAGEDAGLGRTLAAGPAGDKRNLALQSHQFPLSSS